MPSSESITPLSRIPNFDPRTVPVVAGEQPPPVDDSRLTAAALQQRFLAPPAWKPELLAEPRFVDRVPVAAAVLIPIVLRQAPTVLLTQRTAHLSSHSGQIAFPGGKQDATDPSLQATALREAEEEVGLQAAFVQILGNLPVYVTGTAFAITPVVALVHSGFSLTLNRYEVEDAFEVPLAFLMNPENHRHHAFDWNGERREWLSMPYQDGALERFIWGATAGILRNLYRFLAA